MTPHPDLQWTNDPGGTGNTIDLASRWLIMRIW